MKPIIEVLEDIIADHEELKTGTKKELHKGTPNVQSILCH